MYGACEVCIAPGPAPNEEDTLIVRVPCDEILIVSIKAHQCWPSSIFRLEMRPDNRVYHLVALQRQHSVGGRPTAREGIHDETVFGAPEFDNLLKKLQRLHGLELVACPDDRR